MNRSENFFLTKKGIVLTGLTIGAFGALLQKFGNPGNMGLCIACFVRDITGALGLHRASAVQYIRPEIIGIILGAFIASSTGKEFRARSGSAPMIRFLLGFFAMTGCLVFLGCSWRMVMRLAGGDVNAIAGLVGFIAGIAKGVWYNKSGFNLGKSSETRTFAGMIFPVIAVGLLILLFLDPKLPSGAVFTSESGPGSMKAPIFIALSAAIVIGFLAQKTRFCTVGAFKNVIHLRDYNMFIGILMFFAGALIVNIFTGPFNFGVQNQPIAHTSILWNFGGMLLAGLAFTLGGGCPGRHIVLSGQGNCDSGIFVIGMFAGAAFAHNFNIAATPAGVSIWGQGTVLFGLTVCNYIGRSFRLKS
ncbi:YedE family putative selenium transporter [candidate division KSB1 bacterium]